MRLQELLRGNLVRLREAHGLRQHELANRYGCSIGYISQLETGHSRITDEVLSRLAGAFGVDEMEFVKTSESDFEREHAFIPLYNVRAAAGLSGIANGDYPEILDRFPLKRAWLESQGYHEETKELFALITASGDSMEPTINDGGIVLVDMREGVRLPESIRNGRVYVIRWGVTKEEISVKRLHLDYADRLLIATSDNPLYRQREIAVDKERPLSDYVLGKVIWVGKENV